MPASPAFPEAFRIGVKPIGDDDWLVVDDMLAAYLSEKERLAASRFGDIFMAAPDTGAAQTEARDRIVSHLLDHHADVYRRGADGLEIVAAGRIVPLAAPDEPPLWTAARLVQEDLAIMHKGADGWVLGAAALCFPSAWRLAEKFGRPMREIHAEVPDFGAGTRNDMMVARMFDNLRDDIPVLRWNWGLYGDDALFHPLGSMDGGPRFGPDGDRVYLRLERQTLSRLPATGDILFTIRIFIDPLPVLAAQPDGGARLRALIGQLESFSDAQAAYKGVAAQKAQLLAALKGLIA